MQWIETHRDVVYPWQCDHMGHLNVMYYTGMFDRATWHLFSSAGFTATYLQTQDRGLAAVQSTTSYHSELVSGDLIVIRSRFVEIHDRKVRFEHEMTNLESRVVAATSELVGVHIDRTARKACPIPVGIRTSIEQLISR